MREIPGFGVWLAIMTVMSGVVACGPDKPQVGATGTGAAPGGHPTPQDAALGGGGGAGSSTGRPPPVIVVQAGDGGDGAAERPPAPPTVTATTDAGVAAPGCAPVGASGGRAGSGGSGAAPGGGAGATGGTTAPGAGGAPVGSGGATGTGGTVATGGAPAAAGGGAPGTGGRTNASGGGAGGTGGTGGAATGGAATGGTSGSGGAGAGGNGGAGNGGATGPAAAPGDLAIVELLINPASTDTGREWIEVRNRTTHAISLDGLHLADAANDAAVDFGAGTATLPPGGRAVLVQSIDPAKNGGITAATAAVVGAFGTLVSLNNDADTITVCAGACTGGGVVIDNVSWDATLGTGYDGHALLIDDTGKRCPATAAFGDGGSFGTPGAANPACP